MSDQNSFFSKFSPKTNFFLGLGSGVVTLLVLGFFILLYMFLSGGQLPAKVSSAPTSGAEASKPTGQAPQVDTNFTITERDHVRGNPEAAITVVEFSDFQCPYCQQFHPTLQQLIVDYPDDVRWVYKHFPLQSIHPQALPAAEASECVWEQGGDDAFWEFGDALFANQDKLGAGYFESLVTGLGLDLAEFQACISSGRQQQKVVDDYQRGISAGVQGTPGSFINGVVVPGAQPYSDLKTIVDSLL
jgi:protein-disulfide isomerase